MANEKDLEARLKAQEERIAQLMARLEAQHEAQASATQGLSLDALEAIITRSSAAAAKHAGAATELLASKMRPENADHEHKGPFEHPEGGLKFPKPTVLREVWFAGSRVRDTETTYTEAIAVKALSDSLGRGQRRVARDGKWKAIVSEDDNRLVISVPVKTQDDRADLPSFLQILQELTTGERALDAGELAAELAMLKAQFAALKGAAA